jgi:hypothetical protein
MPKLDHKIKAIQVTHDDFSARESILEAIDSRPDLESLITKSDETVREQRSMGRPPTGHPLSQHLDRLIYRMGINVFNTLLLNRPNLTPLAELPVDKENERHALRQLILDVMYTSHQNHNPDLDWVMSEPNFVTAVADSLLARVILLAPPSTAHGMDEPLVDTVTSMIIHQHYTEDEAAEHYRQQGEVIDYYKNHPDEAAECHEETERSIRSMSQNPDEPSD